MLKTARGWYGKHCGFLCPPSNSRAATCFSRSLSPTFLLPLLLPLKQLAQFHLTSTRVSLYSSTLKQIFYASLESGPSAVISIPTSASVWSLAAAPPQRQPHPHASSPPLPPSPLRAIGLLHCPKARPGSLGLLSPSCLIQKTIGLWSVCQFLMRLGN